MIRQLTPQKIWTKGLSKECRGVIATPFVVEAFTVTFDSTIAPETSTRHSTASCNTTYPSQEHAQQSSNPIAGLVVHHPDISKTTSSPYFSLARLAATATNTDWYQTNLPLPTNPEEAEVKPAWVTEVSQLLESTQPFSYAYRYHNPDGSLKSESDGEDEDNEEDEEDEDEDEEDDDYDEDDSDEDVGKATFVEDLSDPLEGMERLHTNRIRIWGMSSSPGVGVTAVFVTLNSAIKPERHTFAGLRCKVLFGKTLQKVDQAFLSTRKLSTEARVFEYLYGDGPPVSGVGAEEELSAENDPKRQKLREAFRHIAASQACVFCGMILETQGKLSRCQKGHVFGKWHLCEQGPNMHYEVNQKYRKLCGDRNSHPGAWNLSQLWCLWLQVLEARQASDNGGWLRYNFCHEASIKRALRWMWGEVPALSIGISRRLYSTASKGSGARSTYHPPFISPTSNITFYVLTAVALYMITEGSNSWRTRCLGISTNPQLTTTGSENYCDVVPFLMISAALSETAYRVLVR